MNDAPESTVEMSESSNQFPCPHPPGRPRGRQNNLTIQRREFFEEMIGETGSEKWKLFVASIRTQFMNGTIAPGIATALVYLWLGKPTERIQISEGPPDLGNLSDEELAHRARILAAAIEEQRSANTIDVTPQKDALTRAEELTPPRLVKKTA